MEFIVNQWPVVAAVSAVMAAVVVFGKDLADLILKWREVLGNSEAINDRGNHNTVKKYGAGMVVKDINYEAVSISHNEGNLQKFQISRSGTELTYKEVLDLWENDREFTDFYLNIFKKCGCSSYIWETPPISTDSVNQVFEFVIMKTPKYSATPDLHTFREYFDKKARDHGVVSFLNLGHDAMLVVPSPLREGANYSGLAEFYSNSPIDQQRALWKETAHQIKLKLSNQNTWVSVAGGGIAWLHIRLDDRPKYYRYMPYTNKCS